MKSCNAIYLSHSLTAPEGSQLLLARNAQGLTYLVNFQ